MKDIDFPTLKLFHSSVYKQILQLQPKAKVSERSSRKNMNEYDIFRNDFQRLKNYNQMRSEILKLSRRYFASIQSRIPKDSPPPILGFKCFTSVQNKYPKLLQDQQTIGEFKKYLKEIYQILKQQQKQHRQINQKDIINLKSQIVFYYYQIALNFGFKIYMQKKKPKNIKSEQEFLKEEINKFYEGLRLQCKQLLGNDEFFNSNLIKLKFALFHLHQMIRKQINEGLLEKLTAILSSFYNLFFEQKDDEFLEVSQVNQCHFEPSIRYAFHLFVEMINKVENSQKSNSIPLRLFQIFSLLKYDLGLINNQKRIQFECLKQVIGQFGHYITQLIITPENFQRLSTQIYQKILKLISEIDNRQNKTDALSEKKLIFDFKTRIQQVYSINFFEPQEYITFCLYQKDFIVKQQYVTLMLRQIISFLILINFRKSVEQLRDDNKHETIALLKNQSNQLLNILLYYYQLQRDNIFLQFQAKILLLEVYILLQIPCKYYIRIYQDCRSAFYGLVSIKDHLINLRQQFFTLNNYKVRSNRIDINEDMITDNEILYQKNSKDKLLPSTQEQQNSMPFQEFMQGRERRYSVQFAVRESGIQFRFIEIKCMKEFLIKVSFKCKLDSIQNQEILIIQPSSPNKSEKENMKNISKGSEKNNKLQINQNQKVKLNLKYVFKQELEDDEKRIFQKLIKVAQKEDQTDQSKNKITKLLFRINASNMISSNFYSKSISQYMKQLLQDFNAGEQQQLRNTIISIEIKLFQGKYDQILNIMHNNTIISQNDYRSFPIFNAMSQICQKVGQDQEMDSLQKIFKNFCKNQQSALRKFMSCCLLRKNSRQKGVIARRVDENLLKAEPYNWSITEQKKLANLNDQLRNIMTVKWLEDSQQIGELKKDTFRIHLDLSSFGSDFQSKFKALKQLLKPYTKIQKKGICRLVSLNKINRQIVITIDVNSITVDTFLEQPNSSFYSQLWFTQVIDRKQHYEELILTQRSDHKLNDEKALMKLREVSQFLIRKTVKNIIFLTTQNPEYQITSDDYIYQRRMNFCDSISINPYFKIINTLFASSNQIQNLQMHQSLKKFHFNYPFARNILNSRLLSLMMLNPNQKSNFLYDEKYKDYIYLCSQSFWNQYLLSISHIIMQTNPEDKYFYEKLPLFQFPLQKIDLIRSSFECMRRGRFEKQIKQGQQIYSPNPRTRLSHQLIPKLFQLSRVLHGQEFRPKPDPITGDKGKDQRFIGIIHYQACSIFNVKNKYSMKGLQSLILTWERNQRTKQEYLFVQRFSHFEQLKCHNFYHFMRSVRNALSHQTFEDISQSSFIAKLILNIQKLRIIATEYPFLLTFLFQKYDDLSAFQIQEVFKNRLNKCNQLLQTIKELKQDGYNKTFHKDAYLITYFNYLINEITNSLNHSSNVNQQTVRQPHNYVCGNKCQGQLILDSLITPINDIINNKGQFNRIVFSSNWLNIQCNVLKKRKIRSIGIIQTIVHLLHYFDYLLRQQANYLLCIWAEKSSS